MHCPQISTSSFHSVSYQLSFLICHFREHRYGGGRSYGGYRDQLNKRKECLTKKRSSSVECYALEGSEPITSEYNQTEPGCLIVRDTHRELYITLTLLLNKSKFNFWQVKIMKNLLCIPFKMLPRFWFIGSSVMPFLIILLGHKYFPCQKKCFHIQRLWIYAILPGSSES